MTCLPTGACGTDADVAYVDPSGTDNNACTLATPCLKVMKALATRRLFIKFHGVTNEAVSINDQNVTLLADPGAKLTRTSNGLLLEIRGSSRVEIYDLEISGASGMNNPGISMPVGNTATLTLTRAVVTSNAGGGISASGGALTVTQSTISSNAGGGISASGSQFDITNSFIVSNGGASAVFGGVTIDGIGVNAQGAHRIDFNTIAANLGPAGVNLGIACGTVLTPLTFTNNIIYANIVSGGGKQIAGMNCSTAYSDIGPDAASGTGNINADPMFVNPALSNFHLMSGSPAKDAADPAATLSVDFDGDGRPQGAQRDIGADEVKP
jgi:hypothetical protein